MPRKWSSCSKTTRRLPSRPIRTSGASAGSAASPNFLLTRSVDQAGRKNETTLGIAGLHFEIGTFTGAAPDQFDLPSGASTDLWKQIELKLEDAGYSVGSPKKGCGLSPPTPCLFSGAPVCLSFARKLELHGSSKRLLQSLYSSFLSNQTESQIARRLADSAAAHSRVTNEVRHIGAVFAFRDENEVGALRRFERDVLGAYKMVGAGTSVRSRGVSQHIQQFRAMSISGSM